MFDSLLCYLILCSLVYINIFNLKFICLYIGSILLLCIYYLNEIDSFNDDKFYLTN